MSPTAQGPSVLIFGATGGIGSALARNLSALGYRLTLAGRDANRLDKLAGELKADARAVEATDSPAVERCLVENTQKTGRLDGVVNCGALSS